MSTCGNLVIQRDVQSAGVLTQTRHYSNTANLAETLRDLQIGVDKYAFSPNCLDLRTLELSIIGKGSVMGRKGDGEGEEGEGEGTLDDNIDYIT